MPACGSRAQSWLDGLQVFLPGIFLAFIVWYAARLVLAGSISTGELVAFYGYAAFLVLPLRTGVEAAQAFTRGIVGAHRVLSVLRIQPAARDPKEPSSEPPHGADLVDITSAIAHRLHTAHDADRVAVVQAGRIAEIGSHSDLVAAGGEYAALWTSWHHDDSGHS